MNNFGIDKATFCKRQCLFWGTVQKTSQPGNSSAQTKLTSKVIELSRFHKVTIVIIVYFFSQEWEDTKWNYQHIAKLWHLLS